MSETEDGPRPFRYRRTFSDDVKQKPAVEMDKDLIQDYINKLFGVKESKIASSKLSDA